MALPIAALAMGAQLVSSIVNQIGAKREQQNVQNARKNLMDSGAFSVPAAAYKVANTPIPTEVLRQAEQGMRETIGTGIGASEKSGSRGLGSIGRMLEYQKEQNLGLAAQGAQAQQQAIGQLAQYQNAANERKYAFGAGEVAGYGEREKERRLMAYQGMSDLLKTGAALGGDFDFNSIFGGQAQPQETTVGGGLGLNTDISQNAYGRGELGGGFNSKLPFDMPSIFTQPFKFE